MSDKALYDLNIYQSDFIEKTLDSNKSFSKTVIIIGGETLGTGDEKIGKTLMQGYLCEVSRQEPFPKSIVLINSGVKLAVENLSKASKYLKLLQTNGTQIYCGETSLDYYKLKAFIDVGEIVSMQKIVKIVAEATNVITL